MAFSGCVLFCNFLIFPNTTSNEAAFLYLPPACNTQRHTDVTNVNARALHPLPHAGTLYTIKGYAPVLTPSPFIR